MSGKRESEADFEIPRKKSFFISPERSLGSKGADGCGWEILLSSGLPLRGLLIYLPSPSRVRERNTSAPYLSNKSLGPPSATFMWNEWVRESDLSSESSGFDMPSSSTKKFFSSHIYIWVIPDSVHFPRRKFPPFRRLNLDNWIKRVVTLIELRLIFQRLMLQVKRKLNGDPSQA